MKKMVTILLFIIMLVNIHTVNTFANSLNKPNIDIDGNNVTIQVQPKKNTTLVITDEKGNRKYIDQSDTENFKVNLTKGKYTAYITDCQTEKFTVYNDVVVQGKEVLITGNTTKNTFVTIEVKDSKGNRKHIDQTTSDNNGEYKFNFSLKSNEKYIAYIKSSAKSEVTHKIRFATTNNKEKETSYKLLPKPGSKNNEYNTEFSMEFSKEVVVSSSKNPQVILKAEKIPGTPKGEAEDKYEKKFTNVLKVDPKNNKKVIIDLAKQGDRLDVDYKYTVSIDKNAILEKDGNTPINLPDNLDWTFDTEWKEKDIAKDLYEAKEEDYVKFEKINEFNGIYVGDTFQIKYKAKYFNRETGECIFKNYPLKWESLDKDIVTVDRNGKIFGKSAGNGRIRASVPQSKDIYNEYLYLFIQVRPHVNRKLQVVNTYESEGLCSCDVSENGNVYIESGDKILCLNPDLTVNNKFNYIRHKEDYHWEQFERRYKINNKEYIKTFIDKYHDNRVRFIDAETGELWKKISVYEINVFLQYEENSPLFIIQTNNNTLSLYDMEKKKVLWKYNCSSFWPDAAVYNGNIYIVDDKCIVALDKLGNELWKYTSKEPDIDCFRNINIDSKGNIYTRMMYADYTKNSEVAIDKNGKLKWIFNKKYHGISRMLYEEKDGVLFAVKEKFQQKQTHESGKGRLIKVNPKNGEIMKEYVYPLKWCLDEDIFFGEYTRNGETLLYTPRVVFDKHRNIIAYTDIPRTYCNLKMRFKNGYMYKVVKKDDKRILQKLKIGDEYTSKPISIDVKDISMYENSQCNVLAKVLDQCGFIVSGKLTYSIKDNKDDVLTISEDGSLKAGKLKEFDEGKYSKEYTVNIRYDDGKVELSKDIKVRVKQTPIPVKMYAYTGDEPGKNPIESVTTDTSGTKVAQICIFVQDQHGELMKEKKIKYEIGDKSILSAGLYQGKSGEYECKYECLATGIKAGKTTVTAYFEENPKIKCTVNVSVEDVKYDLLWKIGTNGPWGTKYSYHINGILNDFIYCNENYITALNKYNGEKLWKSDVGVYYGMEISHPYVDKNGVVYVYDKSATAVAAIDSKNKGQKLWGKFYGTEPVYQMDITDNYIYLITKKGTMYKLDKKGNELWKKKVSDENTKDMEVYSDDISYVVSKKNVYKINGNGKCDLFYKGKDFINVRDISKNGKVLLEVNDGGSKFKAICLDSNGSELWEKPIENEFTAKWQEEKIYILSYKSQSYKLKLYAYRDNGQEVFKPVEHKEIPQDTHYKIFTKERKPIIKNGTIYTYIYRTRGFDAITGKFKWETYISDRYTPSPPMTLTVDDNDVIYSSSGAGGMFAYKVKDNNESTGFNIALNGIQNLKLNSLNEVALTVNNKTGEDKKDVVISVQLIDKNTNKSLSTWATKKTFNKGVIKKYSVGVNVPKSGKYKLIIKAMQGEKILNKVEF